MENQNSPALKIFLSIIAILGWFALIVQFYLQINSEVAPVTELLIRFFSYFTISTNIVVAVCTTTLLMSRRSAWGNFFSKPTTQTAITVYIVVVGIIYNAILRSLWNPEGMQKVVDELLHLVIPVLFLIYWIAFVPKYQLTWGNIPQWLIYPMAYIIYILIRASFSGFYPYPFVDVSKLGFSTVLINSVAVAAGFIMLASIFVALGKFLPREK